MPPADLEEGESKESFETDDCAICMSPLTQEINDENEATENQWNSLYMLTPCNHKFHKPCLRNWMKYKLECPSCRAVIPLDDDSDDDEDY